jgi:hypothetical protein
MCVRDRACACVCVCVCVCARADTRRCHAIRVVLQPRSVSAHVVIVNLTRYFFSWLRARSMACSDHRVRAARHVGDLPRYRKFAETVQCVLMLCVVGFNAEIDGQGVVGVHIRCRCRQRGFAGARSCAVRYVSLKCEHTAIVDDVRATAASAVQVARRVCERWWHQALVEGV